MKRKLISVFLEYIPYCLLRIIKERFVTKLSGSPYERIIAKRFCVQIINNFDEVLEQIKKNNRFMKIEKGLYSYEVFNACYLNNILELILYSLYRGCIPVVTINKDNSNLNKWEWYFKQPMELFGRAIDDESIIVTCDRAQFNISDFDSFNHHNNSIKRFMYDKFVILNSDTMNYITEEIKNISNLDTTLGVLIRGTDYTSTKPSGHPIQPNPNELLKKAKEVFDDCNFNQVYVATEEKRLFNKACDVFGIEKVRQNKREYYDDIYYSMKEGSLIGQVKFKRDNDNYLKGLEYLSSLIILSKCKALVAGNCGGTNFAVNYSKTYEYCYIFDLGKY